MSKKKYENTVKYLRKREKILFILTSNRWVGQNEIPKSSSLAYKMQEDLSEKIITIIDASKLKIWECEGNVSGHIGNNCGVKASLLKGDKDKTGQHRCWASYNNPEDELWKVVNELLNSDVVIFFGSIRWGKMNAVYTKLIERLTWLENRHTTLGEKNILENIDSGLISVGHNWNGEESVNLEKQVHKFFGFRTPDDLYWSYQWTNKSSDETQYGYKKDSKDFQIEFGKILKESIKKFRDFLRF